jgi:hypothetical protein
MKITHDIKTALWCGPAAISAVTGRPTSEIMALARYVTGKQTVKGLKVGALKAILNRLGYRTDEIFSAGLEFCAGNPNWKPTLAKWTRANAKAFAKLPCIVLVTNHYVTVKGRTLIDTFVRDGAPLKKAPWRRARVARVLRDERVEGPVFQVPPPLPKLEPTNGDYRRKTQALARKFGVDVSCENGTDVIWVYPPPSLTSEEDDCHAGDHAAYDWREALARVEDYVRDLGKPRPSQAPDVSTLGKAVALFRQPQQQ